MLLIRTYSYHFEAKIQIILSERQTAIAMEVEINNKGVLPLQTKLS